MPTYEYMCGDCGQEFEAYQSMKDNPLTECQLCGSGIAVKRKIGRGAGIIFKGSGFYETDFKDKKGKQSGADPTPAKSEESKPTDSNSSKKSETVASTSTKPSKSE